jgi:lysyl-tRNA synthetase class II
MDGYGGVNLKMLIIGGLKKMTKINIDKLIEIEDVNQRKEWTLIAKRIAEINTRGLDVVNSNNTRKTTEGKESNRVIQQCILRPQVNKQ